MLTLAFDTSSSTLSVALLDDEKIIAKETIFDSGKQSEFLIPQIEKILRSQKIWYENLGLIAATNGPGSFTGTRIGLTAARTLKLATNLPLVLVNSCEAVAFKYREIPGKIICVLDASMDEFFVAEFFAENGKIKQVSEPRLYSFDSLSELLQKKDFFLCGSAASRFAADKKDDALEADSVGLLAFEKFKNDGISQNLDPLYLRAPRITERKK